MTRQRRLILSELQASKGHPTADDVYQAVRKTLPRISLGTVYRNLEVLAECGAVNRIEGGPQRRYDADLEEHVHIRCRNCGRVDDVAVKEIPQAARLLEDAGGYEVLGYRIEYEGLCPACKSTS
jgi:Fur family ferric uptake transcriptional regulator